jgi:hypothetical protein
VLHDQPFLLKPPLDLAAARKRFGKPLAVLFEQKDCAARVEIFGTERVVTPHGKALFAAQWSHELGVAYTPTIVFFDTAGSEVF